MEDILGLHLNTMQHVEMKNAEKCSSHHKVCQKGSSGLKFAKIAANKNCKSKGSTRGRHLWWADRGGCYLPKNSLKGAQNFHLLEQCVEKEHKFCHLCALGTQSRCQP